MSDPFCPTVRRALIDSAAELGIVHHTQGVMVTIEGPRFSSRAESRMFRAWGGDVINMSTVPEVVLAREAGVCYAAVAMSTDYDSWHASLATVTLDMVMKTMAENVTNVYRLLPAALRRITHENCTCQTAIQNALI